MGDNANDILHSFRLSAADSKKYDTVKAKFDTHFVKRRNVIYERAKFNLRRQGDGESVDSFITAVYGLAEYCGYGNLHDEMIRDRIVVGIRDSSLAKKLQLDSELTLTKAVTLVCQAEATLAERSKPQVWRNLIPCGGSPQRKEWLWQRKRSKTKTKASQKSGGEPTSVSLVPRPNFSRARPADSSKNRVWTLSLWKLGQVYIRRSVNWVIVGVNYIIRYLQRLLWRPKICKLAICDDA